MSETPKAIAAPIDISAKALAYTAENGRRLLDGVNVSFNHGEMVALIGPSGGGKSTLIKCLAGQIRSYEGEILINGANLRELSSLDVARFAGVISQQPYIFSGSVDDNLLYPLCSLGKTAGLPFVPPSLDDRIFALQQGGMYLDVLHFGLNIRPDATLGTAIGEKILALRHILTSTDKDVLDEFVLGFDPNLDNVRQDEFSLEHSLLENLVYGMPRYNDTASNEALLARLVPLLLEHDLLETLLEAGLTHQVGTRGERLSGGQRQRLALSGVLLKTPSVLLLDEVGSALDSHSRLKLRELYERLRKDCTIISVEHNLDYMKDFDRILVMHQGRIVENGTYEELVGSETMFRQML